MQDVQAQVADDPNVALVVETATCRVQGGFDANTVHAQRANCVRDRASIPYALDFRPIGDPIHWSFCHAS